MFVRGVVPSRIVCIAPAAAPAPLTFPEPGGGRGTGIGAGEGRGGLKSLPAAVAGKNKTTALDLRSVSGLLLLRRSRRLHAAWSSGCCGKPVLSVGIHPLAVESIPHPCPVV